MTSKKILIPVFIVVALAQLWVPARMICNREKVLEDGKEYKFLTAPVDPTDPFRGKYIVLSYTHETVKIENEKEWTAGEQIYVTLNTDSAGFARIQSVTKDKPTNSRDFLEAKVRDVSQDGTNALTVAFPFDRYYLEETKAPEAERTYRHSQQNPATLTWALVSIDNGEAVLKDVLIDGVSIKEIVKAGR